MVPTGENALAAGEPAQPCVLAVGAPPEYVSRLVAAGCLVQSVEADSGLAPFAHEADVLLYWDNDRNAARTYIEGMRGLDWVHVPWIGVERLMFPRIREGKVTLTNSAGVAATPVAEYVLGAMLAISKSLATHLENQRSRFWANRPATHELAGRTLLIVGYGDIGSRVGDYARALGVRVEGVATSPRTDGDVVVHGPDGLDDALARADFVLLSLPSTAATRPLMTAERLARMKSGAWLINVGRGDCIDEAALVDCLRKGAMGGAWLDVVSVEPLPADSPLWAELSIVITPHASSWTRERFDRSFDIFLENLEARRAGRPLRNVVVPPRELEKA